MSRRDGHKTLVCNACRFITTRVNLDNRKCPKCPSGTLRVRTVDDRRMIKWIKDALIQMPESNYGNGNS